MAQVDGLVAYVPAKPIERTADSESIGFMASAVGGKAEAILPRNAFISRSKLGHMDTSGPYPGRLLGSALCSYGPWRCDLVTGI